MSTRFSLLILVSIYSSLAWSSSAISVLENYSCAEQIIVDEKIRMPAQVVLVKWFKEKNLGLFRLTNTGDKSLYFQAINTNDEYLRHPVFFGYLLLELDKQENGWIYYGRGKDWELEEELYFSEENVAIGVAPGKTKEFAAVIAPLEIINDIPNKYAYRILFSLDRLILSEPYCF